MPATSWFDALTMRLLRNRGLFGAGAYLSQ